jgi:hemerythrin superfamily protein
MSTRMDSVISKGMGQVKGLKPRVTGLVGVFRLLAQQHAEVTALLERVRGSDDQRAELWPTIRRELVSHERSEVRELYPVLRAMRATRELADHHDDEARELEQLILHLDATELTSRTWGTLFDHLADTVIEHAKEEESQIFPAAQEALGEARAKELEDKLLRAKMQIADAT